MLFTGGDAKRRANFEIAHSYWSKSFEVYTSDGSSLGDARNQGALKAIKDGYEFLFFVDADILFPADNVILATNIAETTGSGVYPYGLLTRLVKSEEKEFLESGWIKPHDGRPEAGALVISSQGFIDACGYPDISWGEDALLFNVVSCFLGPIVRVWEDAFHLYHESTPPSWDLGLHQLIRASELAIHHPEKMRTLIERCKHYQLGTFVPLGYARRSA